MVALPVCSPVASRHLPLMVISWALVVDHSWLAQFWMVALVVLLGGGVRQRPEPTPLTRTFVAALAVGARTKAPMITATAMATAAPAATAIRRRGRHRCSGTCTACF